MRSVMVARWVVVSTTTTRHTQPADPRSRSGRGSPESAARSVKRVAAMVTRLVQITKLRPDMTW